ncbi:MAG: hypothetical protein Q8P24_05650 [Desulfobacterales bacterium]|nr:hypothetical protein [Desulfobacterales bacterium]
MSKSERERFPHLPAEDVRVAGAAVGKVQVADDDKHGIIFFLISGFFLIYPIFPGLRNFLYF